MTRLADPFLDTPFWLLRLETGVHLWKQSPGGGEGLAASEKPPRTSLAHPEGVAGTGAPCGQHPLTEPRLASRTRTGSPLGCAGVHVTRGSAGCVGG